MKVNKEALIINLIIIAMAIGLCMFFWSRVHEEETTEENFVYIYSDKELL